MFKNSYVTFYFKTFARICLIPYIGGTIIHLIRLIWNISLVEIPFEVDWLIVILGGYGGAGLILFHKHISFKNIWDKIAYALLIFHLIGSVILHTYILVEGDHSILNIFPYWYSFIAIGYFIAFGIYVIHLNKRFYNPEDYRND